MKYLFIIVLSVLSISAFGQLRLETFSSEDSLLKTFHDPGISNLERVDVMGKLAVFYRGVFKNDLAEEYLELGLNYSDSVGYPPLIARALWWQTYGSRGEKDLADSLYNYANKYNLIQDKIAGRIMQSTVAIHGGGMNDDSYIKDALALLESWNADTTSKDSVRMEVYWNAAHMYIHRNEGITTLKYMHSLRNYAENHKNPAIKAVAAVRLANMYAEWSWTLPELNKQAIRWLEFLRDYWQETGQVNYLQYPILFLSRRYALENDLQKALEYHQKLLKLGDSIGSYGIHRYWAYRNGVELGYIEVSEAISVIDSDFEGRLTLTPRLGYICKAQIFLYANHLDSASYYIDRYNNSGESWRGLDIEYYLKRTPDLTAIPKMMSYLEEYRSEGELPETYECNLIISRIYGKAGLYELAYEYLQTAQTLKDSVDKIDNLAEIMTLEMNKEMELQESRYREEQQRIESRNQLRLNAIMGSTFTLVVVAFLLLYSNRQKQKSKRKIEVAYERLQNTQSQLIHSEKMASLGELTAGIAHEIKNPLNFVNNFSDINKELLNELMEEVEKGNDKEAKVIIKDLMENEDKIINHGHRADAIVKSMLQHSRGNSSEKELTDINELADEYLRLAYHGLRAKDKSFNADFKIELDETLPKIKVVPQDIGRVLLNLINNAFQATSSKLKAESGGIDKYKPLVTITTRRVGSPSGAGGSVEITVSDNGPGIPDDIKDKIFQPFFTTKSTGQGTGLGLSLSYDIVTKGHGGEIDVKSKEGEGSEFIVKIPIV